MSIVEGCRLVVMKLTMSDSMGNYDTTIEGKKVKCRVERGGYRFVYFVAFVLSSLLFPSYAAAWHLTLPSMYDVSMCMYTICNYELWFWQQEKENTESELCCLVSVLLWLFLLHNNTNTINAL